MQPFHRVVIYDRPALLDPAIVARPVNRATLAVAALSACVQVVGLAQVARGYGNRVGLFDHASFAIVAILWLLLGIMVFLQRGGTRPGRLFLLSAATGSMFLGVGTLSGVSLPDAMLYTSGLLFFSPLMWGFARSLHTARVMRWTEWFLYLPPVLLVVPMAEDLVQGQKTLAYRAGVASVGLCMLATLVQAIRGFLTAHNPEERRQMRALVVGLLAGTLPGILLYVAPLALFGKLLLITTWQPLIILIYLLAMSYAALLFEFSEADLIVRRGIVYGIMTSAIVVTYAVLGTALAARQLTVTNPAGGFGFVGVTIVVGAAFTPTRRAAHRLVDWLLYGGATDRWEVLQQLSARLGTVMQPQDLNEVLVHDLQRALHLRGAFLLRRHGQESYVVAHQVENEPPNAGRLTHAHNPILNGMDVRAAIGDMAAPLLMVHAKPILRRSSTAVPDELRIFDDIGASLIVPLHTRSGLEAVLCLRQKQTHDSFTTDDLQLLAPIMGRASAALDNALLFSRLDDTVSELRRAYVRLADEQELERARLARELHDGTAQELAGIITLMVVLERQLDGAHPAAHDILHRLQHQAEDAYQGVRRSSHALRPVMLDGRGLLPALTHYLSQFQEATSIEVEMSAQECGVLPANVEMALFRVVQECMENVRKHSESPTARIALAYDNGEVKLSVSDQGRGIDKESGDDIGMVSMRERLAAVAGTLWIENNPGQGVRIQAVVPMPTPVEPCICGDNRENHHTGQRQCPRYQGVPLHEVARLLFEQTTVERDKVSPLHRLTWSQNLDTSAEFNTIRHGRSAQWRQT